MALDLYGKFILTIVAVCLALLVAQGFGLGALEAEPAPGERERSAYRFIPIPQAGIILRLDEDTGETWSLPIRGSKIWSPVGEGTEPLIEEEPEPGAGAAPQP